MLSLDNYCQNLILNSIANRKSTLLWNLDRMVDVAEDGDDPDSVGSADVYDEVLK